MTLGSGSELARRVTPFHLNELPPQPWRNGGGITREILVRPAHPSVATTIQCRSALALESNRSVAVLAQTASLGGGLRLALQSDSGAQPATLDGCRDTSAWDWRVSVADNVRPGPFSTFAGVDRQALLLDGPGLTLHDAHGTALLRFDRPGETQCFVGEAPLHSQLPQGPARLLNAMTRRGHAQAGMAWHGGQVGASLGLSEDMACVLLVVGGRWHVRLKAADGAASVAAYELGPDSGLRIVGVSGRLHLQGLQPDSTLAQVLLQPATASGLFSPVCA